MEFKASENLAEQIRDYLANRIIGMELMPGERILEAKLSEELKVSRGPIREALRILEKEMLVELIPRRGARVTRLTEKDLHDLFDVLIEFLSILVRRCIENCDDDHRRRLQDACDTLENNAHQGDTNAYISALFEFINVGLEAAFNPLLSRVLNELMPSIKRVQYLSMRYLDRKLEHNLHYFKELTRYVGLRNAEMGVKVIRDYVTNEFDIAIKALDSLNN
ncbi:MAG TPA: GntR family transcriptional regulator [Spirochaetota bacterium]|nr:GntR family transcriptional regulator [Spirochaetota bacterium]HPI91122.1 GntR family transcriptional regulator [Spirochaetota bacterium]